MSSTDTTHLANINTSGGLAGSNIMEILLFTLGTRELFGINVFKVREVCQAPQITKTPNMPFGIEGVISLRGNIIPIISLATFIYEKSDMPYNTMIVTEFSRSSQAFLVNAVDRIIRVDWRKIRSPDNVVNIGTTANSINLISAITELDDGKLVSILDVEQILSSVVGSPPVPEIPGVKMAPHEYIFFADDSVVARKEISSVVEKMGIRFQQANNGREAWERLQILAGRKWDDGESLHNHLKLILVDAEMPEIDGYVLTRMIKEDKRFSGIPVVMHSSLSSNANKAMGASVGVDAYVAKFEPRVLAETILSFLQH